MRDFSYSIIRHSHSCYRVGYDFPSASCLTRKLLAAGNVHSFRLQIGKKRDIAVARFLRLLGIRPPPRSPVMIKLGFAREPPQTFLCWPPVLRKMAACHGKEPGAAFSPFKVRADVPPGARPQAKASVSGAERSNTSS